jgi:hypothetical protein
MENIGIGVGLAALAFWGFVATAVVAGIWDGIRKRDAQHETLRRMIESGQPVDQELMNQLSLQGGGSNRPDKDFYITGLWLLPVSVGMFFFALILGATTAAKAEGPLLGVAALLACLGIGWIIAAKITARRYSKDSDTTG